MTNYKSTTFWAAGKKAFPTLFFFLNLTGTKLLNGSVERETKTNKLHLAHHLPQREPGIHGNVVLVEIDIL